MKYRFAIVLSLVLASLSARAETPEEWIKLVTRVHGGFGSFIPLGVRIGEDALGRLNAGPREVTVTYYDGEKTPCPCVADGIMLATTSSPGQGTLTIAPEKARPGLMGAALVRHRMTGRSIRYEIPAGVLPKLVEWNKAYEPMGRYEAVMKAEGLFSAFEQDK